MDPEVIERATKAAYESYRQGMAVDTPWDGLSDKEKEIARNIALAVIAVVIVPDVAI